MLLIQLQSSSAQSSEGSHASSSNGHGSIASSNGNAVHVENGHTTGESQPVHSRTTTIVIDPESGEARNATKGETMEIPLQSPVPTPMTPPPVPIAEFQHLATESDLQVCKFLQGYSCGVAPFPSSLIIEILVYLSSTNQQHVFIFLLFSLLSSFWSFIVFIILLIFKFLASWTGLPAIELYERLICSVLGVLYAKSNIV